MGGVGRLVSPDGQGSIMYSGSSRPHVINVFLILPTSSVYNLFVKRHQENYL